MASQWERRDRSIFAETSDILQKEIIYMGGDGERWDGESKQMQFGIQSKTNSTGSIVVHEKDIQVSVNWLFSHFVEEENPNYLKEHPVEAFGVNACDVQIFYRVTDNLMKTYETDRIAFTWNQIKGMFDSSQKNPLIGECLYKFRK